ncbi:MAG: hypothetical protein ACE5E5_07530 [Phycisphaerae bacterium]
MMPSPQDYSLGGGSRAKKIFLWIVAIGIAVPGGYGFIEKFIQFVRVLLADKEGGFTIIPIANYLTVAAGMTCLLVWAILHGMFRDIERPKHLMLEREARIEEQDRKWEAQHHA